MILSLIFTPAINYYLQPRRASQQELDAVSSAI
jgi:hypothetical protein